MAIKFDFKCEGCGGLIFETTDRDPTVCPRGHSQASLRRIFNPPAVHREMQAQFAPALGTYVNNKRHHVDLLKRASDAASEDTGMEHRYVPIDMADKDATRRTEE